MIKKFSTDCCALCQLSITDDTSKEEILRELRILHYTAYSRNLYGTEGKDYGQRNVFVMTTPTETNLVANLKAIGFKRGAKMNRRIGYPNGNIIMWIYSF